MTQNSREYKGFHGFRGYLVYIDTKGILASKTHIPVFTTHHIFESSNYYFRDMIQKTYPYSLKR